MVLCANTYSHGLTSTTAKIALRPGNLIELRVQFDFMGILNHRSHDYSLPVIASLPEDKFGLLYNEVIKLFKTKLTVKLGNDSLTDTITTNMRFPSQQQVMNVLKRQFIQSQFLQDKNNTPYTFSDRRFYQVFSFDFRLNALEDLKDLSITFPKPLGEVYVTYSESSNQAIHSGSDWRFIPIR